MTCWALHPVLFDVLQEPGSWLMSMSCNNDRKVPSMCKLHPITLSCVIQNFQLWQCHEINFSATRRSIVRTTCGIVGNLFLIFITHFMLRWLWLGFVEQSDYAFIRFFLSAYWICLDKTVVDERAHPIAELNFLERRLSPSLCFPLSLSFSLPLSLSLCMSICPFC